jgi:hypothetical protein
LKIGFTGTSDGMSTGQMRSFYEAFKIICLNEEKIEFHHGDCVGADEQAHKIISKFYPQVIIVGHPPVNDKARAFCSFHFSRDPLPYLDRNKKIVDHTDFIFAAPKTNIEELRSGTWSTVRYARKMNRHVTILPR